MEIPILYEDDNYVVVNKPAGLVVHPDGKTEEKTLIDWILARYPEIKEVGEPLTLSTGEVIFRPGIVHRLDRDTTGSLLIAKNQKAYLHAKQQFKNRTIHKTYRAFVYGNIKAERETINRPIGRSKTDFRKWTAQRGTRGDEREATTVYRVLERSPQYSYIEAIPLTGRTHQIRVHMKAINHPVVADKLYAPNHKPGLGFERLALHSMILEFKNMEGIPVRIEAPLPADFQSGLQKMRE